MKLYYSSMKCRFMGEDEEVTMVLFLELQLLNNCFDGEKLRWLWMILEVIRGWMSVVDSGAWLAVYLQAVQRRADIDGDKGAENTLLSGTYHNKIEQIYKKINWNRTRF